MTTVGLRVLRTGLAFDVHDDVPEPEGGIVKCVMVRHAVPTDGRPDPARGPRQRQRRG